MENPRTSRFDFDSDDSDEDFLIDDDTEDSESEAEDDCDNLCPICLASWTTTGEHMATRLKCRHVFGLSCIRRWVKRAQCCPLCKRVNYKRHMRGVYQCLNNRWDRAPTQEELDRRDRRRQKQARKRRERRAMKRITRPAAVTWSQDGQGDDLGLPQDGQGDDLEWLQDGRGDDLGWIHDGQKDDLGWLQEGQGDERGTAESCR